jgi:ATP-dependent Clp protease adapter protein ClpS
VPDKDSALPADKAWNKDTLPARKSPVPDTVTISKPKKDVRPDTGMDRGWKVILFDDEVTPLQVVVFALQRAANLSIEVAEMVTDEAQREGQAVVKRGLSEEDAQIICGGLRAWTRIEGICPGVRCEKMKDDP